MKHNFYLLALSIFVCELVGALGSIFTSSSIKSWYIYLNKPSFNPPNFVFAPVWTTLYFLMGVSFYLFWINRNKEDYKIGLFLFFIQLFLNFCWSLIFFGWQQIGFALIEIVFLWLFIVLTMLKFYSVSKLASLLLLPYLLWVSFAAFLNFTLYRLN